MEQLRTEIAIYPGILPSLISFAQHVFPVLLEPINKESIAIYQVWYVQVCKESNMACTFCMHSILSGCVVNSVLAMLFLMDCE